MAVSDYASIVAISVSIISITFSIIRYNKQRKYIKTQDELNQLLLAKEKKEVDSSDEAIVSANMVKMGKENYRIRVFNKGKGRANNVDISYPEDHDWIIMNRVFPLEFLLSGQSVELMLAPHMGAQSKIKAVLTWNDKNGEKKNEVILTY